jgi:hypothetical protein
MPLGRQSTEMNNHRNCQEKVGLELLGKIGMHLGSETKHAAPHRESSNKMGRRHVCPHAPTPEDSNISHRVVETLRQQTSMGLQAMATLPCCKPTGEMNRRQTQPLGRMATVSSGLQISR